MKAFPFSGWISNTRNLAFFHIGLFLLSGVVVGVFLYLAYHTNVFKETKAALRADVHGFSDVYHYNGSAADLKRAVEQRLKSRNISSFYLLMDEQGRRIIGNLKEMPQQVETHDGEYTLYEVHHDKVWGNAPPKSPYTTFHPYYDIMALTFELENGMRLLVGRDVDLSENFHWLIIAFAWMTAAVISVLSLIGFLTGTMILKNVRRIHTTADQVITTGDLSSRIPVRAMKGDFKRLADTLNAMLNRIQDLVTGIRQVSDNIAHDMRTPLTRLRHHIESLKEDRDPQRIDQAAAETDRIIATFNALLQIANIEYKKQRESFRVLDLADLLSDIHEYYELIAEDQEIGFFLSLPEHTPLPINGDENLLFQAFSNLVENAVKFTPSAGTIALTADCNEKTITINLTDTGPGIDDADKPFVFRRLYRAQESRHTPGSGLGLSLVKAVMDLHQTTLALADNPPSGLKVQMVFPMLSDMDR